MRRTITSLSLVTAAATCALAIVSSASAATQAARIICPESNGLNAPILSCCPPPLSPQSGDVQPICCQTTCCPAATTVCCQTTTCCPSTGCCTSTPCATGSLSIASSPNPSMAGRKVVISGALAGHSASGVQVVLWGKLAGHASFQQMGQTTTDTSGRYTFTLPRGSVMTDQAWYVASTGVQSATVEQHVDALVGLSSSTHTATAGQALRLRGQVTPSHVGETVLIEQRQGGAWRVLARAKLSRTSSYSLSHRFTQHGTVRLRAVLRGDARNDTSVSSTLTLTVKP